MRKLHWLNHLGTVELDVELDSGQTIEVECTSSRRRRSRHLALQGSNHACSG